MTHPGPPERKPLRRRLRNDAAATLTTRPPHGKQMFDGNFKCAGCDTDSVGTGCARTWPTLLGLRLVVYGLHVNK